MSGNERRSLVPRLRFPEFCDDQSWSFQPLGKLAKRSTRKNADGEIARVLTNSAEFGVIDQRDFFDKDIANQGNLEGYYIVEEGDYVYNPRISAAAPVGPVSKNRIGLGVMSPLYTVFRFNNKQNDFYAYYFKSTHWHQYMRQASSTGARHDRMSITNDDFMGLPLPVSKPEEQQKIAEFLSSLDDLIMAETQKLEIIKTHKKGLMQQLFPCEGETVPRLRFPEFRDDDEWESDLLGNIFDTTSGGTPSRSTKEYWDGYIPWLTTSLVNFGTITHADEFISEAGLKNSAAKIFPRGTVLIAMYGQGKTRGQVALLGIEAATNQACAAILPRKEIDPNFVFLNLASRYEEIRQLSNSGGQENLSQGLIRELPFSYPLNPAEQQKITTCLTSVDNVINAQAQKIEALISNKNGLTQQLFPLLGEVLA